MTTGKVYDSIAVSEGQYEFRKKYRGYRPWQLAKVRADPDTMYEFTSWPYEEDGKVMIMARVLEDPTTNCAFRVRREIALIGWGHIRQREFRSGWKAGQAYMRFVQQDYARQRDGWPSEREGHE